MKKNSINHNTANDGNMLLPAVFQKELNKLAKLNAAYKEQLDKVVDVLKDTYGHSPYDVDCDFFIDTYCQGAGNMTVKQLDEQMKLCCP